MTIITVQKFVGSEESGRFFKAKHGYLEIRYMQTH